MLRFCSIIAALWLALPIWAAQPEFSGQPRVIDGDTLEIAGARIRLGGIDAPEQAEECTGADGTIWPCGRWATQQARALLEGQTLRCVDLGDRTHGRIVGRCYLHGHDIAALLIETGAARPCLRFAQAQGRAEAYLQAEQAARAAGAGIYGGPLNPVAGFCAPRKQSQEAAQTASSSPDCEIKGNVSANGRIYHLPGQMYYERVSMRGAQTRWFCSEAEAQAAGWRRSQR